MCLAIVKPSGIQVPKMHLTTGWQHNPNGAGYAFVKDGKVEIHKGFMKLKDFLDSYEVHEAVNQESNFLIHFRITSQGSDEASNTHPFEIDGGALIHNGTLSGTGSSYGKGESDTCKFANMFAKNLSFDFVQKYKARLNDAVRGSKLCMLYENNTYQIVNESDGQWVNGVWYSNGSWRNYRAMTPANYDDADWETEDDLPWPGM